MNARERVVTALNHEKPDRVPIDLGGTALETDRAVETITVTRCLTVKNQTIHDHQPFQSPNGQQRKSTAKEFAMTETKQQPEPQPVSRFENAVVGGTLI